MNTTTKVSASVVAAMAIASAVVVSTTDCYRVTCLADGKYKLMEACVSKGEKVSPKGCGTLVRSEPMGMTLKPNTYATGEPGGFESACSTGRECEALRSYLPEEKRKAEWVTAPLGVTLAPGRWRGAGCFPKPGVELARRDVTSWPEECPTK